MDTGLCILCIFVVVVVVMLWSNNENYQPQYSSMGKWSKDLTPFHGSSNPPTIQEIALRSTTTRNNSNYLINTANNTPDQPVRFNMMTYF